MSPKEVPWSALSATLRQRNVRTNRLTCLLEMHNLAMGHSRGRSLYSCSEGSAILLLTVYQWQQCFLFLHSFVIVQVNFCHGLGVFLCLFRLFGWRSWVLTDWGLLHLVSWVSKVLKRDRLLTMFRDAA